MLLWDYSDLLIERILKGGLFARLDLFLHMFPNLLQLTWNTYVLVRKSAFWRDEPPK